jgi:hypothetical protein
MGEGAELGMAKEDKKEIILVKYDDRDARVGATVEGAYSEYYDGPDCAYRYVLLKCPQCTTAILALQNDDDARYSHHEGHDTARWGDTERLFPKPETRQLGPSVPETIRTAFGEAISCFEQAKSYTASAIMCRKVLEGICDAAKAKGKTLAAQLKDLHDKGEIDKRLYEWITELRLVGNEAAHDVTVTVSREDASDLLDFTEATAQYLYTFKNKFDGFKARRANKKAKKQDPDEIDLTSIAVAKS